MKNRAKTVSAFNCPNCGGAASPDSTSCAYCGSALAVRVCPSCFGRVSVGMMHCPSCGAEVADSVPESASELKCPHCEENLSTIAVGKHSMHECMQCGGLWLDKKTFQEICTREEAQEAVLGYQPGIPEASRVTRRKRRRAYIPCPECKELMNTKNFSGSSGVVLDWCREHGSWFDKGELQRIVTFIRNGGLHKARERDLARLKEEESRLRFQQFETAAIERRFDSSLSGNRGIQLHGSPLLEFLSRLFSS